jgi:hypothetical protein
MNNVIPRYFVPLLFLLYSCSGHDCNQLPHRYSSYEEAINIIKKAHFKIEESVNTSKSSWIRGASYYSCDGRSGFFFLKTDKKEYLYSNMPLEIWLEFKKAESFGGYYNQNIKHNYIFQLNK